MADDTDAATVREGTGRRTRPDAVVSERYQPIREIARGGMGRVIEALDTALDRTVALKEILDEHPDARARFDREVQITARLEHPSIVPLYDAGTTASGAPFYVMRKVAGEPLDALIRAADSLDQRLRLLPHVLALADAVAHAHARGVIHRDLKPTNVLVGELGETVVIDWGLAKLLDERDAPLPDRPSGHALHTRVGTVFGTPGFMPPEQLAGEPVDERADVYALGGCLYHVLAGERPTDGMTRFEIAGAPPDLVTIISKAMAADKAARYLDAGGFSEDLRRFLGGQLVAAHDYPLHTRIARWLRRHRAVVAVTALAFVLAIGGAAWSFRRILAEQGRAEDALAREQLRADDLLLFKASAFAATNPTLAVATLQQLREDSPRWATLGPVLAGLRARGVGYGYPGLGRQIRRVDQSPDDERILVSAVGVASLIDPIAHTSKRIVEDRDLSLARWWRGQIVLFLRRGDALLDPERGTRSPAPWPIGAKAVQLGEAGTAFYLDGSPAVFALDRANRTRSVVLPEPPRSISCDPAGGWVAAITRTQVHLLRLTDDGLAEVLALDAPDATVALGDGRLVVGSRSTVIEYALADRPAERRRWTTESAGMPVYVAGELHWWTMTEIRVFDDDRPRTLGPASGFGPEAPLPGGRIARLTEPRTIELVGGGIRHVLRAPDNLDVIGARPERRFVVGAGASRVIVWDLDDLAFGRTALPIVDSIGFTGPDRVIATRTLIDQRVTELRLERSLAVTRVGTYVLDPEVELHAFAASELAIGLDPVRGRGMVVEPARIPIELDGVADLHLLDARSLIAGTRAGTLHRIDRTTGKVVEELGSVGFPITAIAARAGWILAIAQDGRMWRRDPHGAITTTTLVGWRGPQLVDDGTVYSGREREVVEWRPDGTPTVVATFAQRVRPRGAIVSEGARFLVIATEDGTLHRFDRRFRITSTLVTGATAVAAAGGTLAAVVEGQLVIADIATGTTYPLAAAFVLSGGLAVSPDGARVVAVVPRDDTEVAIYGWRLDPPSREWVTRATNAIAPERLEQFAGWRD